MDIIIRNCIIIFCLTSALALAEWVDPHNMNTNAKAKYVKPILKKSQSALFRGEELHVDNSFRLCSANLRRIVSVLLNSAYLDKRDPEIYKGHIQFNIKPHDFDFLLNFGKDEDLDLEQFRKLDTIFSESFKKSYVDAYRHKLREFGVKLYSAIFNIETLWILGVPFLLYVVYQFFRNDFSFMYVAKYLIILVLIVDFGYRYKHLLQEVEKHNLKVAYSKQCDSELMSWTDWTKYLFGSLECEKKCVTPLDVMLYQIKYIIIVPMQALGTGMGEFGSNMFTNLPWGLNLILWPFMLIFTLLLTLNIMTLCTGNSIEFNLFHMIKMRFGGDSIPQSITSNNSNNQPVEPVPHRPMVQNIHITVSSTKSEEENISKPAIEMVETVGSTGSKKNQEQLQESDKVSTASNKKDKGTNTAYVPASSTEEVKVEDCNSDEDEAGCSSYVRNSTLEDAKSPLNPCL